MAYKKKGTRRQYRKHRSGGIAPPMQRRRGRGVPRGTRELWSRREMLHDAPTHYAPQWLDHIQNDALKAHVRDTYMAIRAEQDDGRGITALRDLMIRRLVYSERICNRLEMAMEHWTDQYIAGNAEAEARLLEYQRFYSYHANVMRSIVDKLGLADRGKGEHNGTGSRALTAPVRAAIEVPDDEYLED